MLWYSLGFLPSTPGGGRAAGGWAGRVWYIRYGMVVLGMVLPPLLGENGYTGRCCSNADLSLFALLRPLRAQRYLRGALWHHHDLGYIEISRDRRSQIHLLADGSQRSALYHQGDILYLYGPGTALLGAIVHFANLEKTLATTRAETTFPDSIGADPGLLNDRFCAGCLLPIS